MRTCIADVSDARRMRELFLRERPEVVFHAAAYKHVPLVEANPDGGFVTNVLGTLAVCKAAVAAGSRARRGDLHRQGRESVELHGPHQARGRTDGACGRVRRRASATVLSAVRFGNVLGSRGSVVPTLLHQIDRGQPITITASGRAALFHDDLRGRQPGVALSRVRSLRRCVRTRHGRRGPHRPSWPTRLVRLKGLRPGRDVAIQYIGLRPGEKLREELHSADERLLATERTAVWRVEPLYAVNAQAVLDGVDAIESRRREGRSRPRSTRRCCATSSPARSTSKQPLAR